MQPVVILGGFLITDEAYGPMAQWLEAQGGIDVSVVHASRLDWLLTSSAWGWQRLLQRVDQSVRQARDRCGGAPVTLIGHSSGGVMLRLYLAEHGLEGASLNGAKALQSPDQPGQPPSGQTGHPAADVGGPAAPRLRLCSAGGLHLRGWPLGSQQRASQRFCPPQRGQLLQANRRSSPKTPAMAWCR